MIEFKNVSKLYDNNVKALSDVNISIESGEFVFLVGHSGAGKSTLFKMLLKEVEPTSGEIYVNGQNLRKLPKRKIPKYRRKIGVVFQDFRLLEDYNVYENSQGTGTREAGTKLRNDVINIFRREKRIVILDFSQVQTVSSSFIDEFIAKMILHFGLIAFNKFIRIVNMNENVTLLCERSFYMRICDEWQSRKSV